MLPHPCRNPGNYLPDEVVQTLLTVCRKNAVLFQRYFKFKAGCLGLEKSRRATVCPAKVEKSMISFMPAN